jgi:TolB-like protein/DNA-binding winged helix-turn-helix (wHTH) protein/rhodanese-related sulfurtransferase
MASQPKPGGIYCFGPFRLDAPAGVVTRDGVKLPLSARAFEVLHMLARRGGGTVTRDELLAEVCRGVTVEENNLTVQVSALRRALGDMPDQSPVIITVPNQGYRLAGTVVIAAAATPETIAPPAALPAGPVRKTTSRPWWAAGALATAAAGFILLRAPHDRPLSINTLTATPPSQSPLLSLVILPFRNLATDHQDDPVADAVSDDLTTEMAHMPAATVIARETADSYKGRSVPTAQIGNALAVRYVLEGSLRGLGPQVTVNAQLIDAASGAHVWASRFDVPRDPAAALQPSIVYRVASGLRTALIEDAAQKSLREAPQNPSATDLYVRARAIWERQESPSTMQAARSLLEQAIKLQPDFVPALAELGAELATTFTPEGPLRASPDLAEAHDAIDRALGLARDRPEVRVAQGFLQLAEGQNSQAEASFHAALAADPGSRGAATGLWISAFLQAQWQDAYDGVLRAQQIDPGGFGASIRDEQLGILALAMGRPAEAEAQITRGSAAWPAPRPTDPDADDCDTENVQLAAAHVLDGDLAGGRKLIADANIDWPHRSAFRCARFGNAVQMNDPGIRRAYAALLRAGLPEFADEYADDGVPATTTISPHRPLDPSPRAVPGIPTIDTAALVKLTHQTPAPLLIDVGSGSALPAGAVLAVFDPLSADATQHFAARLPPHAGRAVVVLGDGVYGWRSYNAVLQLHAAGVTNLIWYRGGEEAWSRAGLPARNVRAVFIPSGY